MSVHGVEKSVEPKSKSMKIRPSTYARLSIIKTMYSKETLDDALAMVLNVFEGKEIEAMLIEESKQQKERSTG